MSVSGLCVWQIACRVTQHIAYRHGAAAQEVGGSQALAARALRLMVSDQSVIGEHFNMIHRQQGRTPARTQADPFEATFHREGFHQGAEWTVVV